MSNFDVFKTLYFKITVSNLQKAQVHYILFEYIVIFFIHFFSQISVYFCQTLYDLTKKRKNVTATYQLP